MTKPDLTDRELDSWFATARSATPAPRTEFLEQIAHEAVGATQPKKQAAPAPGAAIGLRDVLGGWRGFGGLALAGVTGLWIGIAPPSVLPDPAEFLDTALGGSVLEIDALIGGASTWILEEEAGNV